VPPALRTTPPTPSQVFVSYAWGDDLTPDGRAREAAVNALCAAAEAHGIAILRDRTALRTGDSIFAFMRRIGAGDRIFVFLSEKYLRSPFCMFELSEIWRTSRQDGPAFLDRVRLYPLPDANYRTPQDWVQWSVYWKDRHDELDALIKQHGSVAGAAVYNRLIQTQKFYAQVSDILALLADSVAPRDFEDFMRHGFDDPPTVVRPRPATVEPASRSPARHPPNPRPSALAPRMAMIPAGRLFMGSPATEARWDGYDGREEPRHLVRIAAFEIGVHPVTVDAFAEFIAETKHDMGDSAYVWESGQWESMPGRSWLDPGFSQAGDYPVTCVSWDDARAYVAWLNERLALAGQPGGYRLPSEAEWEYACRADTTTPFSFGETITTDQANFDGNYTYGSSTKNGVWLKRTSPAGQFPANAFGLHNMHGNVWEWCEDDWHANYVGAPADGSAWKGGDASHRVVRGGSWYNTPDDLRSARRERSIPTVRGNDQGLRLARTVSPSADRLDPL
jgi:formylglycine-generating enzyme required for sulfatase activity